MATTPANRFVRSTREHRPLASWLLTTLAIAAVLGVVLVAPRLVYPPISSLQLDRQKVSGKDRIQLQTERLKLQNDGRATLLQGLGGAVLLLGAYFTWRQLLMTREGQVTERFTSAVEHLGHDNLDVRLGGIYALERIAWDSAQDRTTIVEVLSAYVRGHAPWPPVREEQPSEDTPIEQVQPLMLRAPDVQAALTVLGRSRFGDPFVGRYFLGRTDLRWADLSRADFRWVGFSGADLQQANVTKAQLQGASFLAADLRGVKGLREADLSNAALIRSTTTSSSSGTKSA